MLDYENASAAADIRFERIGGVLTIKVPKEGFVRGAGHLLRSWRFWAFVALLFLGMNAVDLVGWLRQAFRGRLAVTHVSPELLSLILLQPAGLICLYVLVVAESAATIRLYRTELVYSTQAFLSSTREAAYARGGIERVHVGWLNVSIERRGKGWFGMCRRVQLFTGRTREERLRVAKATRTWLDECPTRL